MAYDQRKQVRHKMINPKTVLTVRWRSIFQSKIFIFTNQAQIALGKKENKCTVTRTL